MKKEFLFLATAFVLLALTCATVRAQQQTPASETSNEPTMGTISGLIVNERGEPIPGASVFLRAIGTQNAGRTTSADGEGRFRVTGLEAGLYLVSGHSPAYVYQPPEMDSSPSYYRVGDSVRVEMIKGGVITGTVVNATGEPIVGIRIRAVRIRDPKGQVIRTPQFGNTERTTDDRGIYRIYGLAPGSYLISAGGAGTQSFQLTPYETDVPMYAPSSTRDGATEFTVRSGEETTADIRYRSDQGHTVSGTVKVNGTSGASVTLMPAEGGFMPVGNVMQAPGARGFEISGVGDGEYQILAMEFPIQMAMTTIPDISLSEPKRITVKGADVSGIDLITRPASSVSGRIVLEPSKVAECQGKRRPLFAETLIDLMRNEKDADAAPLFMRMNTGAVSADPKGAFMFRNLSPGRYRLNTSFYARFWYLQSISIGAPATSNPATPRTVTAKIDPAASWTAIKPGEKIADLTITLAEGAASIRGRVPVAEGTTIPSGTAVYLVPAEADKAADVLRYFMTNVSGDGTFTLNNLPPGRFWSLLQNPVQAELATLVKLRAPESAEARTKLRRTAESQKSDLELKPCQTLTDYQLAFK